MPGAVDFKERISRQRPHDRETYGHAGNTDLQDIVYQLESDRGRIVNSAAVRRLQQKTQVFPLERNAAVRSRLTHSLEVQQTGRFIVRTLFRQLGPRAAEVGLDGLVCALLPFALGSLATPAMQGLLSARVPVDRQGELQGVLSSLMSLAAIVGPPLMSGLFHWGSGPLAPLPLAGAPFLAGALLVLAGLVLAWQLRPTGEERSWTG